jgi:hypothetical protein
MSYGSKNSKKITTNSDIEIELLKKIYDLGTILVATSGNPCEYIKIIEIQIPV